eukprot:scaffold4567_cov276-Chaetoceros_neogracile.AAC.36
MFSRLTVPQKRLWGVGAAIVGFGLFKGVYFYLSRDVIIKNLAETDKEARLYLKESEDFSKWAADDRQKRLKHKLTPKQKEQVQLYLLMMAENEKDIYPYETKGMKKRIQERS